MLRGYERWRNVIDLSDEAVSAPPTSNHGVAGPKEIVGKAQPWIEVSEPVRLTTQRNTCINGVPIVSGSVLARVVVRQYAIWIEDCHTNVLTVIPVTDVLHTRAKR